jgi:hypothetical protein
MTEHRSSFYPYLRNITRREEYVTPQATAVTGSTATIYNFLARYLFKQDTIDELRTIVPLFIAISL